MGEHVFVYVAGVLVVQTTLSLRVSVLFFSVTLSISHTVLYLISHSKLSLLDMIHVRG